MIYYPQQARSSDFWFGCSWELKSQTDCPYTTKGSRWERIQVGCRLGKRVGSTGKAKEFILKRKEDILDTLRGQGACTSKPTKSIADQLVEFAQRVDEQGSNSAGLAENKLSPIMETAEKSLKEDGGKIPISNYPPFFEAMRAKLVSIEDSFNRINSALNRTAL